MEAQLQIARDHEERRAALADLKTWLQKQKSNGLEKLQQAKEQQSAKHKIESSDRPPASLNQSNSTVDKGKVTSDSTTQPIKKRNSYTQWDNFDFDAALAEVDKTNSTTESVSKTAKSAPEKALREAAAIQKLKAKRLAEGVGSGKKATPSGGGNGATDSMQRAEAARQEGNEAFKHGNLDAAEAAYTRSITLSPMAVAYANRAAVHLKRKDFYGADADSTRALELDSLFLKAWHRRGSARQALGRLLEAAQDFEEALRLDPKNKIFQSERRACIEAWKQKYHVPQTPPRVEIPIQATPPSPPQADHIDKAPDTKEGSSSYSSIQGTEDIPGRLDSEQQAVDLRQGESSAEQNSQVGKAKNAREAESSEKCPAQDLSPVLDAQKSSLLSTHQASSSGRDKNFLEIKSQESKEGEMSLREPNAAALSTSQLSSRGPSSPDSKTQSWQELGNPDWNSESSDILPKSRQGPSPAESTIDQLKETEVTSTAWQPNEVPAAVPACSASTERSSAQLQPPKSGTEFETVWRGLRGSLSRQAGFLLLLEPAGLPQLFKQSLTGPMLASILTALLSYLKQGTFDSQKALELLENFQKVPRFAMVRMSISRAEKDSLRELWDEATAAQAHETCSQAALKKIRPEYGL